MKVTFSIFNHYFCTIIIYVYIGLTGAIATIDEQIKV